MHIKTITQLLFCSIFSSDKNNDNAYNHNYSITGPDYFLAKRKGNMIKNTRKQSYTPNFSLKTININKTNVKLWYFYISACNTVKLNSC